MSEKRLAHCARIYKSRASLGTMTPSSQHLSLANRERVVSAQIANSFSLATELAIGMPIKASEHFGILCLSETWNHPLLWAHYAEGYHGICLGLRSEKTRFLIQMLRK